MTERIFVKGVLPAVIAVTLALVISLIVIWSLGYSPLEALEALAVGAFGSWGQLADTLATSVPLILVALGWIIAIRAGRISIGFEGQIVVGGIAATAVGVAISGLADPLHLSLALLSGVLAGAAWAGIAAYMWARRGVNEIISTLLLNLIAIQILAWLLQGPLQEPTGALPTSEVIPESARWGSIFMGTALSWVVIPVAACVVIVALLPRTVLGRDIRMTGLNEGVARYAGISTTRTSVLALVISGALGGFAGTSIILGTDLTSLSLGFSANYGFEGIVVALLARNHPVGAVVAGILFAALIEGGRYMEATVGVSASLVLITQGIVILLVTAPEFIRHARARRSKASLVKQKTAGETI